jgi:hypothetical protein
LKDDNIKEFIKEERIIDAYTLYILNAFSNPRMNIPISIKNSTELNNEEKEMTDEQFVLNYFITTNDDKDRLHTETIKTILNDKGYSLNIIEVGRLMNRTGIGKYFDKCSINKEVKRGFKFIKYIEPNEKNKFGADRADKPKGQTYIHIVYFKLSKVFFNPLTYLPHLPLFLFLLIQ